MIIIRFPDEQVERRALGFLAKRYPLTTWADGDTLVPPAALGALAVEGIPFTVKGRATYEQNVTALRSAPAGAVQ